MTVADLRHPDARPDQNRCVVVDVVKAQLIDRFSCRVNHSFLRTEKTDKCSLDDGRHASIAIFGSRVSEEVFIRARSVEFTVSPIKILTAFQMVVDEIGN